MCNNTPASKGLASAPTKMSGTTCAAASNNKPNQKPSPRSGSALVLALLRTMLLDVPLMLLFIALLTSLSANHIYGTYYVPLMEALKWPGEDGSRACRASARNATFLDRLWPLDWRGESARRGLLSRCCFRGRQQRR